MANPWDNDEVVSTKMAAAKNPWDDDEVVSTVAPKAAAPIAKPAPITRTEKVIKGMRDPIDGGAQLLTNMLPNKLVDGVNKVNNWLADNTGMVGRLPEGGVDQQVRDQEKAYQAKRAASGEQGFDGYRLTGNVFSPANLAIAARAPQAASLVGRMGVGAGIGAVSAGLAPVGEGNFADEKAKQVAIGATLGGLIPGLTAGVNRLVSPNASKNAELALLKAEGVRPTVGQALGGRWNALEEKLTSLPIFGDGISSARRRAQEDFNKSAINRATKAIGVKIDDIGHSGIKQAGDAISGAYNAALSKISGVKLDPQFNANLTQLHSMAQGLTSEMSAKFNRTLSEIVMRKVSRTGSILPDDYKAIDSELGKTISQFAKSSSASEQEFGGAVQQLQALLKEQMVRSNPTVAKELKAADSAWAQLVRVEGAAKAAKNNTGVFTPAQLNGAIQAADDSVRGRAVARGNALMQNLGTAGQNVLGNKVPNSGTAERLMYGAGSFFINPLIPASLVAGAGAYTSPLQRLLVASVSSRPASAQGAANALRKTAPALIPGASQFGAGISEK